MQNDTGTAKAVLRTPNEQKNQPQRKQKALPESEKAISLYKWSKNGEFSQVFSCKVLAFDFYYGDND